ncbi:hypothetical protein PGTUg99_037755 [Puccinia graminis f. sp. tritici]|uniref:C2H2-type domain-containing protein n=1 Tax=Puccinia graminis f. sp. tritici TaxID=56615 RepID=A0A5B0SRG6_PUCGR|nr:hypothetical protein PGTUg99_037755 [Puccinia graminis f. sp. tritici]
MSADKFSSSPLNPHDRSTDQQSREAYTNARRQPTPEIPEGSQHLHSATREQTSPAQLTLSNITLQGATSHEAPLTPISRWLRNVEPVSPRLALRTISYWSPDSDVSMDTTSISSVMTRDEQSPAQNCGLRRQGPCFSEGIRPTNPGYRPAEIQPTAGPSNATMGSPSPAHNSASHRSVLSSSPAKKSTSDAPMLSSSPAKKCTKSNAKGKAPGRAEGKKKHGASTANAPRRAAVAIPMSRLRSGKTPACKLKVLPPPTRCSLRIRPSQPPIYCCPICGFECPLLSGIKQHVKDTHPH